MVGSVNLRLVIQYIDTNLTVIKSIGRGSLVRIGRDYHALNRGFRGTEGGCVFVRGTGGGSV